MIRIGNPVSRLRNVTAEYEAQRINEQWCYLLTLFITQPFVVT